MRGYNQVMLSSIERQKKIQKEENLFKDPFVITIILMIIIIILMIIL